MRRPGLVLLGLAAWLHGAIAGSAAEVREVAIVGTAFRITLADGRVLAQDELVGAVLDAADAEGEPLTVRIDGHEHDASASRAQRQAHWRCLRPWRPRRGERGR